MIKIIYPFFILAFVSCIGPEDNKSTPDSNAENNQRDNRFREWLSENRKSQNEALISFDYDTPKGIEYELDKVNFKKEGDTLTASFVSSVWVGCLIIGDIEFKNASLELILDHACDPVEESFIEEEADLEFTFVVSLNGKKTPQNILIGSGNLINR